MSKISEVGRRGFLKTSMNTGAGIAGLVGLPTTPLERGWSAFRRKDFAAAIAAFQQAVRNDPGNAFAYKSLGMVYTVIGKFDEAVAPFSRACSLDPREENACYYLGRTLYQLDRFQEANQAFHRALEYAGNRGRPLWGIALAQEALGNTAEAESYYKAALKAGEGAAAVDYGKFLFKQGRVTESLDVLRRAHATAEVEKEQRELQALQGTGRRVTPAPLQFDQTELPMIVRNGASGEKHQIETMIAGVAVLDYDNDGWPDIFVANGARADSLDKSDPSFYNRLFHNNHDGTFTDVTDKAGVAGYGYSMGVAAADYDNDGWTDLFVTGVRHNILYHNRGDATFEDVTHQAGLADSGGWSVAAGWFDYDNDGLLDLFVVRYVAWDPQKEVFCGDKARGIRTYCDPRYYAALPNALYHNLGGGRFRDTSVESGIAAHPGKGMGVAFGDFDGDGFLDVFVANDTEPNMLFHNQGNGTFREQALDAGVAYDANGAKLSFMGADIRDCDNDGREDIFVTALTNEMFHLYRSTSPGRFEDITDASGLADSSLPWSGWSCGAYDFNNDGFKDLFTANGNVLDNAEVFSSRKSRQPNAVFLNRHDGTFVAQLLPGEAMHRGAAFADFDRDGRVDVVVTALNDKPRVLRNVTPGTGHWLALRLTGTRSNRDAIGAWVHITTASGEQWNRVSTSVGYGGSSDRTLYFGLGADAIVRAVDIRWPSGAMQRMRNISADRYINVREPSEV